MEVRMGRRILVLGGTGYIGRALTARLVARGDDVVVLARRESRVRVADRATVVPGNALDPADVKTALAGCDTAVQLVGTPHPGPAKAAEFRNVDLAAAVALARALPTSGAAHVVYVSVAQPAPVMRAYVEVRAEGERRLTATGVACTFLRPWYVLGPGHRWPLVLVPLYALAKRIPATREVATRLDLCTLDQMVATLACAVATPAAPGSVRILDVQAIRRRSTSDP
jgi:uncharacterized protein YbjT (DUF2867 family)